MTIRILRALERSKDHSGPGCAEAKLALLRRLERTGLRSARAVFRLHELLCFLRAYPDDARELEQVERMLERFSGRADLKYRREALTDSGIAGAHSYRFLVHPALARPALARIKSAAVKPRSNKLASALPLLCRAKPLQRIGPRRSRRSTGPRARER